MPTVQFRGKRIGLKEDAVRAGRIMLDPSRSTKIMILHDPCNLVRLGGVVEEQRLLLKSAVANFIEMTPQR